MIENYQNQLINLVILGKSKINALNDIYDIDLMNNICHFEKGIEIGSKNYLDHFEKNSVHYLRVGDLDNLSSTFIKEELSKNNANENDVLIALDGAPGRNAIGLKGAFSSGIYKVVCDSKVKGLIYFELNSKRNQKIISDYSQGTTILHASKAIQYLEYCKCDLKDIEYFNSLLKRIVELKKSISSLKYAKQLLLNKYF